jgi:hypothetical protein
MIEDFGPNLQYSAAAMLVRACHQTVAPTSPIAAGFASHAAPAERRMARVTTAFVLYPYSDA